MKNIAPSVKKIKELFPDRDEMKLHLETIDALKKVSDAYQESIDYILKLETNGNA